MNDKIPLISIKSKYVKEILNNNKKWEFRKIKINNYNNILVYETKPIGKITLLLNISDYIIDTPENIWKLCKKEAGISENDFFKYFENVKMGYAYKIESYKKINIDIKKLNITPPTTVKYIDII